MKEITKEEEEKENKIWLGANKIWINKEWWSKEEVLRNNRERKRGAER